MSKPKINEMNPMWVQDGKDFILDLGTIKKAAIVALYGTWDSDSNMFYAISPRSFFPFTNEQQDVRFEVKSEDDKKSASIKATKLAEKIIVEWLNSIMLDFNNPKAPPLPLKPEQRKLTHG
jgi:hypothetical protein